MWVDFVARTTPSAWRCWKTSEASWAEPGQAKGLSLSFVPVSLLRFTGDDTECELECVLGSSGASGAGREDQKEEEEEEATEKLLLLRSISKADVRSIRVSAGSGRELPGLVG